MLSFLSGAPVTQTLGFLVCHRCYPSASWYPRMVPPTLALGVAVRLPLLSEILANVTREGLITHLHFRAGSPKTLPLPCEEADLASLRVKILRREISSYPSCPSQV